MSFIMSLAKCLSTNKEPLLQTVFQESLWSGLEEFKHKRTNEWFGAGG